MAVRQIRFEGDPVLLETAAPVEAFDASLATLVRDMFETMYDAPGRGLAAPQVGVSRRVFVVDTTWKEADPAPMIFVNPQITAHAEEEALGTEACLSIPDQSFDVSRPVWVALKWQDLDGAWHEGRFTDVDAVCICHEFDHLEGLLITQTGTLQ
ncbi:peptide deformylase [Roseobacter sp. CCS2]|uniref:peptide deformylase n=1 Tax=Roseobacter sp. CCS2 TaxID=391593 RepID=UPI0000F4005F|nr:peptide deformylase [Roseobacter sp. CCS2]EBA13526.1 Peptide deformylase [Roseobacter sp. CCS2]